MSRSYVIENRPGMPGAFVRVTDETPAEARERCREIERHARDLDRSIDLGEQHHRDHLERMAARDEEDWT